MAMQPGAVQGVSNKESKIRMLIPRFLINTEKWQPPYIIRHGVVFLLTKEEIDVTGNEMA